MHKVFVKPHVELVSIRYTRRNGKGHVMGACSLKSVTVKRDGLEGELLEEFSEVRELGAETLKHFVRVFPTDKGFVTLSDKGVATNVTGNMYRAAYVCGPEFYVSR